MFCHSNRLEDGKGMGLKAKIGAYGCSSCHDVLDGRAPRPADMSYDAMQERFDRAVKATQAILEAKGLPTIDDHSKAARKIAKKLSKGGLSRKEQGKKVSQWAYHMKAVLKGGK